MAHNVVVLNNLFHHIVKKMILRMLCVSCIDALAILAPWEGLDIVNFINKKFLFKLEGLSFQC